MEPSQVGSESWDMRLPGDCWDRLRPSGALTQRPNPGSGSRWAWVQSPWCGCGRSPGSKGHRKERGHWRLGGPRSGYPAGQWGLTTAKKRLQLSRLRLWWQWPVIQSSLSRRQDKGGNGAAPHPGWVMTKFRREWSSRTRSRLAGQAGGGGWRGAGSGQEVWGGGDPAGTDPRPDPRGQSFWLC